MKGEKTMKEYVKPEVEFISLQAQENITNNDDDLMDGEQGLASSIF